MLMLIAIVSCDTASIIDPPDESFFLKYYGGEGNQQGVDAVLNSDGTITLFGTTVVGGIEQLYLVNIEQNGRIVWEKTVATPTAASAKDIELTNDGRLVIVADLSNTDVEHDILIMTVSLDGNVIASTTTGLKDGGGVNTDETAISVTQTTDGFIVSGSTNNLDLKPIGTGGSNDTRDALHLRYFDDLTDYPNTWRRAHGPGNEDFGVKIVQISATQFYFFSYTNTQTGDFNYSVLGLGADGETNSPDNFLPGISGSDEILSSVITSPIQSGEGFLLGGVSEVPGSNANDIYIVKLRKTLTFGATDLQFQKSLAVNLGSISPAKISTYASANGGFLILANEKSGSIQNFYLTKVDNNGFIEWDTPVIFGGEHDDQIGAVLELPDGSIGIVGTFGIGQDGETKMTFIKVNKEGKFLK